MALAAVACDFGTLDALSQDEAARGSTEVAAQAIALWNTYDRDDERTREDVSSLEGVVGRAGDRPVQVTIDSLAASDVTFGPEGRDPARTQGMLVVTELTCSLAQVERIVVAKNQDALYPKSYDRYARTYEADPQPFLSNASATLRWKTTYTVSLLNRSYEAVLSGGVRRIERATRDGKPMLLSRTVLDMPARFVKGDDASFDQDYQVEAFYEREPNRVIHFYAMWRDFRVGSISSRDDLYQNVILGNLVDFDGRMGKVCRDGTPEPTF